MADRTLSDRLRGRMLVIPLTGLTVALAGLCLALLASAQSPPIRVEKTASPGTVYTGDTLKYTAVLTNDTDSSIDLLRITDTLPSGFQYLSLGEDSDILHDPNGTTEAIVWDQGPYSVPGNGTLRLEYWVKVDALPNATPFENLVEALPSTGGTVSASAAVSVVEVSMTGSKSANSSQVPEGDQVDYQVILNNDGTATAHLGWITDTLPVSFAFQSMVSGPLPEPDTQDNVLVWAGPIDIPAGEKLEFTYRVAVSGTINQAYQNWVSASLNDQIIGPYQASVTVTQLAEPVPAYSASIRVGKTASPGTVYTGDTLKYTAVFTNDTGSSVDLLCITDTLPSGFQYLTLGEDSDILQNPSGTTGTIVWDQGPYSVPGNGTLRLEYKVKVNALPNTTPFENLVEALPSTGGAVSASAAVSVVGVNMTGSKNANFGQVPKGTSVIYKVILNNDGTATAHLGSITDTLPASFVFQSMVSGPLPNPTIQANTLVWAGPIDILVGEKLEFTYRVAVGGTINQTYKNSVKASLNDKSIGPYEASVTVTKPRAYLPIISTEEKEEPPEPVYRLAYDSKPGDNYEIYAVDADGTDLVNVSNESAGDLDPDWSPDGTQIAWVHFYDGKGDVLVANADGTSRKNVSNHDKEDRAPDWSPDGSKIAFASYRDDRWEVYTVKPDGTSLTQITDNACQSHDPVWSPDGTMIAYVCGLDQWAEVYVANADGSSPVRLTDNEVPDEALDWSPDSTRLVYVRYDGRERKDSEIWVVNVDTATNTRLTDNDYADYSPVWAPDGTRIAFSTYMDSSYEIALMNPDGSNIVNLTHTAKGDYLPRWAPDGLMISFISNRLDDNKELYVMDASGNNQFRLTDTSADETNHDWKPQ